MALIIGTNCGFVVTAPVDDPNGSLSTTIDNWSQASKDTSDATASKITEVGFWVNNATQEANFEVGLYTHHGANKPGTMVHVVRTNAKGTGSGWKTVVVDWAIDPDTIYWIAVQLDNTSTTTTTDWDSSDGASRLSYILTESTLIDPWPSSTQSSNTVAIYAVWDTGVGITELSGTIVATSTVTGNMVLGTTVELAGTIAATTTVTGNLVLSAISELSGTIAAQSTVGPSSLGSTTVGITTKTSYIKRLVTAGNNQIWYENI